MLGGPPGWGYASRILAAALTFLDAIKCPRGHYTDETTEDGAEGWFEVDDSTICEACAAIDNYRENNKDKPPVPGALLYVRDLARDDDEEDNLG